MPPKESHASKHSFDWENDSNMKKMLEKKVKSEDAEFYNQELVMLQKREAVKAAAEVTPAPKRSTDLDFDDEIAPSIDPQTEARLKALKSKMDNSQASRKDRRTNTQQKKGQQDLPRQISPSKWATKSKRARRRSRSAARRKIDAEQQQLASQLQVG